MYDQLMVDLETLGTKPGAVILSVALVEWNWKGEIGKKGVFKFPLAESVSIGFMIEPGTVDWWNRQDKQAFAEALDYELGDGDFNAMIRFFQSSGDVEMSVWGNGARFEFGLLAEYFEKRNIALPWKHTMERDVRTIVSLLPEVKKMWNFVGNKHNPLDDCENQIGYLVETLKNLCMLFREGNGGLFNPEGVLSHLYADNKPF
ncbi:MAG TPA: 3'-5' exonuclease [Leadbetterella sp.]|nr:3'-5' exonuclease [Leadbetterella sp.]